MPVGIGSILAKVGGFFCGMESKALTLYAAGDPCLCIKQDFEELVVCGSFAPTLLDPWIFRL